MRGKFNILRIIRFDFQLKIKANSFSQLTIVSSIDYHEVIHIKPNRPLETIINRPTDSPPLANPNSYLDPVPDAPEDLTVTAQMSVTAAEWRWVTGWTLLMLGLTCLPIFIVWWLTPAGWHFTGILVNPLDGHSYLAKVDQGIAGNWLFQMTYTPEPHSSTLLFTFYIGLGHLARLTGLPPVVVFHLARLLAGLLLLLTIYRFIAHVTSNIAKRRLAFIFMGFVAGLGWLGVAIDAFGIDLWVPEAFVHYSLQANPHFPLGLALMLLIFIQVVWPLEQNSQLPLRTLHGAILAFLLAMVLPFGLVIVWVTLAVFIGGRLLINQGRLPWTQIWPTLGVVGCSLPVVLYQYWLSITNPILIGWSAQNVTSTPPVSDVAIGFGLIGLLAIIRIVQIVQAKGQEISPGEWLLVAWAVSSIILLYVPFALQRRFITGLHIPLAILAAIGLLGWLQRSRLQAKFQRLIVLSIIISGLLSTIFVWGLPMLLISQQPIDSPTTSLLFIRQDEAGAFNWLRENTQPDEVILASPRIGMFVPGQTGARTFYGHPFETIEAQDKEMQVEAFYRGEQSSTSPASDYIFYGPSEQAIGQPESLSNLPVVFTSGEVSIYKVQPEQ